VRIVAAHDHHAESGCDDTERAGHERHSDECQHTGKRGVLRIVDGGGYEGGGDVGDRSRHEEIDAARGGQPHVVSDQLGHDRGIPGVVVIEPGVAFARQVAAHVASDMKRGAAPLDHERRRHRSKTEARKQHGDVQCQGRGLGCGQMEAALDRVDQPEKARERQHAGGFHQQPRRSTRARGDAQRAIEAHPGRGQGPDAGPHGELGAGVGGQGRVGGGVGDEGGEVVPGGEGVGDGPQGRGAGAVADVRGRGEGGAVEDELAECGDDLGAGCAQVEADWSGAASVEAGQDRVEGAPGGFGRGQLWGELGCDGVRIDPVLRGGGLEHGGPVRGRVGAAFWKLEMERAGGGVAALAEFRGHPVVFSFWGESDPSPALRAGDHTGTGTRP